MPDKTGAKGPKKPKTAPPRSDAGAKLGVRIKELEAQVGVLDVQLATARANLAQCSTTYQKLRAFVVERYGLGVLDVFDSLP